MNGGRHIKANNNIKNTLFDYGCRCFTTQLGLLNQLKVSNDSQAYRTAANWSWTFAPCWFSVSWPVGAAVPDGPCQWPLDLWRTHQPSGHRHHCTSSFLRTEEAHHTTDKETFTTAIYSPLTFYQFCTLQLCFQPHYKICCLIIFSHTVHHTFMATFLRFPVGCFPRH